MQLTVSRVPGQPAPAEAVLFVGTAEVAQDGTRTLLGSSVATAPGEIISPPLVGNDVVIVRTIDGKVVANGKPGPMTNRLREIYVDFARATAT